MSYLATCNNHRPPSSNSGRGFSFLASVPPRYATSPSPLTRQAPPPSTFGVFELVLLGIGGSVSVRIVRIFVVIGTFTHRRAPAFPHWLPDPEHYSCSPMVLGIGEATHCKLALLDATKRVVEVGGDLTIDYDKTRRRLAYPWHTSWRSTRRTWWLLSAMPVTARGLHAPIISRPNSTEDNSHRIARTAISSVFLVSDYTRQNREKARRNWSNLEHGIDDCGERIHKNEGASCVP
uniref:Uncharacterized protein n=1 Tax=Oryza sativa subsp. japonica TaxID=39947 RepID=Q8S627_ORYSJ|nr:hypothetical protein [Oryza sativa Japonica Group]